MVSWQKLGTHRFYVEGDVIFTELHGDFGRDEIHLLWDLVVRVEQEHGHVFRVFDARDGLSMTPEARQYINDRKKEHAPRGPDVIVGANIAMRTLVTLIQHAARLLKLKQAPVLFLRSLDEVPPALEAQRLILLATAKLTKSIPPSEKSTVT